jgi:hypothetical protein
MWNVETETKPQTESALFLAVICTRVNPSLRGNEGSRKHGKRGLGADGDLFDELDSFRSLSQREQDDMNTGDTNNSHGGGGGGGGGSGQASKQEEGEGPEPSQEQRERERLKIPATVRLDICFDFSNGQSPP